jgi:phenylacetate-CoA ligase
MAAAGQAEVQRYGWSRVAPLLLNAYRRTLPRPRRAWYTALVAGLLFPLHEWLKRHDSVARRRALERTQWWPAARLQQLQLERLRALLIHVARHVPYYRTQFAALGFDPAALTSLTDLTRLPLLRKADISAHRDAFKSALAGPLMRFNTGGSSGEPLVFFIGRQRISHDVAAKWRATRWWNVDIGDPETVLWGSPIELKAQDRVRRLRDWLLRSTLLPAFDMGPARLDGFIGHLRRSRPRMLFGYPSALSHLARHARTHGVALDGLGIRVVFVTSERLYDQQRALIGDVFGCPVANGYGGRDAGFIAHECPHGGMHISAEDIIVEVLDAAGQPVPAGVSGAIAVTHLATGEFPFIRYLTGDVGALDATPCRCGRGLPLLKSIDGRSTDFVVALDGTVLHGLALVYLVRDLPQVRAFKIIQESLRLTRVQVVALPPLDDATRLAIVTGFRARLGFDVVVAIEDVAAIPAEASGKFRYVVSKVAPPSL